ncbi:hypothetical protein Bca4012_097564 [Brassica carinata]
MGVNKRVKKVFNAKAQKRLLDTVSNWKGDWIVKGYERGKPPELATDVWDGLIRYWRDPDAIRVTESCSASRQTVDEHGHRPMLHSTGQKLHAGVRMEIRTHKNKADQFLDARSEQIFNDLVGHVEDRQTQLTQQSTDGLPVTLSTLEVDKIYEEVVPKKKGRTLGIGSVNDVPKATSSYGQSREDEFEPSNFGCGYTTAHKLAEAGHEPCLTISSFTLHASTNAFFITIIIYFRHRRITVALPLSSTISGGST